MATQILIQEGLDYWEKVAKTLNQLANQQPDGKLPHNNQTLYNCIHKYDRTHWIKAIGVVKRLKQQAPQVFGKDHIRILNEVEFLIFQTYPNLTFEQNPLDYFYRKKTNNQKHQGFYLSKWGFKGLTMLREVWNNCNPEFTGNNGGSGIGPNSPAPQFNKLFDINKPKGDNK